MIINQYIHLFFDWTTKLIHQGNTGVDVVCLYYVSLIVSFWKKNENILAR